MPFLAWFTVPTVSDIVVSSSEYTTDVFTEFLPILWVVLGLAAAVGLLMFLRKKFGGAIHQVTMGRRGRGRRRR